jgi:hypothetical protein
MAEYIKLEDAKKVVRLRLFEENYSERQVDIFINDISKNKAADVVEVVRCNCCKYYDKSTHNCGLYGVKHWGGFFCGDAEKEDEDNG